MLVVCVKPQSKSFSNISLKTRVVDENEKSLQQKVIFQFLVSKYKHEGRIQLPDVTEGRDRQRCSAGSRGFAVRESDSAGRTLACQTKANDQSNSRQLALSQSVNLAG